MRESMVLGAVFCLPRATPLPPPPIQHTHTNPDSQTICKEAAWGELESFNFPELPSTAAAWATPRLDNAIACSCPSCWRSPCLSQGGELSLVNVEAGYGALRPLSKMKNQHASILLRDLTDRPYHWVQHHRLCARALRTHPPDDRGEMILSFHFLKIYIY